MRGLWRQLRAVARPTVTERELDEEHEFHIQMETERLIAEGIPPVEARRRAMVAFGGVERFQQQVRESRWTWAVEMAWTDARYALRSLVRRPLFSLSAIGTLAVAIGIATTSFSVVEAVLLRPLPVSEPEGLLRMELATESGRRTYVMSFPDYLDYREQAAEIMELAAYHLSDVTLSSQEGATAALGMEVSSNYFRVLGLAPATGRFFLDGQAERLDGPAEVVLAHDLWRTRFGGDPSIVGRVVHVNGAELTVVGVAPAGFHGTMLGARPAVFLPLGMYGRLQGRDIEDRTGTAWLQVFGRLDGGVSVARADEALDLIAGRLAAAYDYPDVTAPEDASLSAFSPLPPSQHDAVKRSILILLASAVVLLLITAVNVAGMLLARAMQRGFELSVKMALGAGSRHLTGQLLVEGLMLGAAAGLAGVGVGALCTRLIGTIRVPGLPQFQLGLPMDGGVLAFAAVSSVAMSVVFALMPAYTALRRDALTAFGSRGEGVRTRGRSVLVAAQVAMTLVLLVSSGLLLRTLENARDTEHGFDPRGLVMAEIDLRLNRYDTARARAFYTSLLERLEGSPDIRSAALSTSIPLGQGWDQTRASVPGVESPEPSGWPVGWSAVSDGFFETLGFELRAGGPPDREAVPPRIVINEELARRLWNEEAPLGRQFRFNGRDAAVAGVVPTGKYRSFSEEPALFAYFPLAFAPSPALYVHVRPTGDRAAAVAALRAVVSSLDPHVPLINVTTLDVAMGQSLFLQRAAATFIGAFALMALLLSATGIYGLLAFMVERRRREMGIRMALGASGAGVVRSVLLTGLGPVLGGLVVGLGAAAFVGRALRGLLYDVPSTDPVSMSAAGLFVIAVAAAAVWMPTLRATRLDPATILNEE